MAKASAAPKRAPFINRDQLAIYATNHRGSLYIQLFTAAAFLLLKHKLYGLPVGVFAWAMEGCIVALCLFMLFQQIGLYKKILAQGRKLRDVDVAHYMNQICINKLIYMIPWLALLFQPLQVQYVYPHLLGYVFIFVVTATYASASAAMLPLLAFDVGIPALFGIAVAGANWHLIEVQYIAGGIFVVVCYAFIISNNLRKSTMRLIEARRTADEANRAKSSFLALMSHEIRTPMTGIFGMIDFLKETPLTDDQRSFVFTISECSKTLLNTLNDILDFSKIESGKLGISKINFQFHGALENSARVLTQIAEDKGLELKLNIAPDVPKNVYGDPHRIQQVVMNLVNNAVKFTQQGSVTINATFVQGAKPMLKVEVIDTGIGISQENISKLFSAFSQADSTISRRYGGSGLGLSIAKSLIGLMGGRIDVSSVEGKGSTFWFEVPYEAPHEELAAADAGELNAELPPMNILVAEDNAINARVISHLLTQKGHHVTVVQNGSAAVSAVKIHPYSLILMDVNMPVMNGIDATRAIRAMGSTFTRIPIIGLTANILDEYVRKCYAAGMNAYVAKPFSPEALLGAMVNVMKAPEPEPVDAKAPQQAAPAPTSTGYTVVGQKKELTTKKTMEEVLIALRNELGLDYLQQTIANDTDDVQKLFGQVEEEFKAGNFEKLGKSAHDLKSTSGLIGMQETSGLASRIQDDCLNGQHGNLGDLVAKLAQIVPAEAAAARDIAMKLPEA
jgi:signal transduction histidine kinase/DNA-binding response OmpR family regulator